MVKVLVVLLKFSKSETEEILQKHQISKVWKETE